MVRRHPVDLAVADLGQYRVHHHQQPDGDGEAGARHLDVVKGSVEPGHQPSKPDPEEHGGGDPYRQEPVEDRQPCGHSARLEFGVSRGGQCRLAAHAEPVGGSPTATPAVSPTGTQQVPACPGAMARRLPAGASASPRTV